MTIVIAFESYLILMSNSGKPDTLARLPVLITEILLSTSHQSNPVVFLIILSANYFIPYKLLDLFRYSCLT